MGHLADEQLRWPDKLEATLQSFASLHRWHKTRIQALADVYGDYLSAESAKAVTEFHHRYVFVPGSGGEDFAFGFAAFMLSLGAKKVIATLQSEYYMEDDEKEFNYRLELDKDKLWSKSF